MMNCIGFLFLLIPIEDEIVSCTDIIACLSLCENCDVVD